MRANLVSNEESTKKVGCNLSNLINLKPKIDSYRILIPRGKVDIIDKKFGASFVRYYHELEEFEEELTDNNSYTVRRKGITARFQLCKRHIGYNKGNQGSSNVESPEDVVLIFVNAKMLKERYLEGITRNNLELIYNYIQSLGVVKFSLSDFQLSKATDVDFCIDLLDSSLEEHYTTHHRFVNTVYQNILHTYQATIKKYNDDSTKIDNASRWRGLQTQFAMRAKATPAKPFITIYDKSGELLDGELYYTMRVQNRLPSNLASKAKKDEASYEFYYNYLKDSKVNASICKGITRIECSLRNNKTLDYYSLKCFSILDYLDISEENYRRVCKEMFAKYTTVQTVIRDYNEMTPMEKVILNSINQLIRLGMSKTEIEGYLLQGFEDRSQKNNKSRMKGLINGLFLKIDKPEILEENNIQNKKLVDRLQVVGLI